jgi:hypothetical protein
MNNNILKIGDLLTRPKALGIVHVGVAVGNDAVFHNSPLKGEHVSTVAEFAKGQPVHVHHTGIAAPTLLQRVGNILATPRGYSAIDRNCEHSVTEVLTGKAKSPQLLGWIVVAVIVVVAAVLWLRE